MRDDTLLEPVEDEITVSLPVQKKDLGTFISALLNQKQSIERDIDADFDIDHAWVINLHETIHQRINQQADAYLTNFTATIYLEGGLKRTFTSFEAFQTYSETKKQIPIGIKIIWIYLVQFPTKKYPEKQQITFSAQIHLKKQVRKWSNKILEFSILDSIIGEFERSSLNYQIDHSERTWGDDIESIISNQVDGIIRGNKLKDALFNISRLTLALLIILFSFIYPSYLISSSAYNKEKIIDEIMTKYSLLGHDFGSPIELINKKLDFLAYMIEAIGKKEEVLLLLTIVGPPVALIFLRITRKSTYSFLVFNKESEKDRALKLAQEKRSTWILIGSFCLSILSGVIGNYGFSWLVK